MTTHDWLAPGGHLLIEIAAAQADAALTAYRDGGLDAWIETDDDYDATLALGRKAAIAAV